MSSELSFQLLHWCAWAPGLDTQEAWRDILGQISTEPAPFHALIERCAEGPAAPDVSFVPMLMRRRLSDLSKMALYAAHHCLLEAGLWSSSETQEPPLFLRSVFASRHGELHRTLQMLKLIAQQQPISPTHFSQSVHNTSAGLFSILCGNKAPHTAISAGSDTFFCALLDALGWLHLQPGEPILLVMADQPLPDAYQRFVDQPAMAYALAFLLASPATRPEGDGFCVTIQPEEPSSPRQIPTSKVFANSGLWPQALEFLQWMLSSHEFYEMSTQQSSCWRWRKTSLGAL